VGCEDLTVYLLYSLMFLSRFRLVYCQLERLRRCILSSVRGTLQELPESLDEMYASILRDIAEENREHAYRLLQCLTVAARPLRIEELAEVNVIDFTAQGTPKLNGDLRWEDQEEAILLACSSLVAVIDDEGSRVVQFSHLSVKEFLTSDRLAGLEDASYYCVQPEPAHIVMAQACLAVLLRLDYHSTKSFPLADYATAHFGNHAEFGDVISHIRDGLDTLLDPEKPHFAAWCKAASGLPMNYSGLKIHPLYYVAGRGFVGMAKRLISRCPQDVNVHHDHRTPLHAAAEWGNIEVSRLLLGYGADIDIGGPMGQTPLHLASRCGHLDIAQLLLDEHDRRREKSTTSLRLMAKCRWSRSAWMPLVRSAGVHACDDYRSTPLHLACENGYHAVAQLLLDRNADVDAQDMLSSTPLHQALHRMRYKYIRAESFKAVRVAAVLVKSNANVNAQNHVGLTPLHIACQVGDQDIVQLLLGRHADTEVQDRSQSTPLLLALEHWERWRAGTLKAAVKLFIESGANVNVRTNKGQTLLHLSCQVGSYDVFPGRDGDMELHSDFLLQKVEWGERWSTGAFVTKLLIQSGANVNVRDKKSQTPLHIACQVGGHDLVQSLLGKGADMEVQDDSHSTPLLLALEYGARLSGGAFKAVVKLLVESGANVKIRNNRGQTPLHLACKHGYHDIVRLLLDRDADVEAQDNRHSTPLHLALFYHRRWNAESFNAVATLLIGSHSNVNVRNNKGQTTLHLAAECGCYNIVRFLLGRDADVNAQDKHHSTPLHLILGNWPPRYIKELKDVAMLLIKSGADINIRNDRGQSPLHVAAEFGYHDIVRLLLDRGVEVDIQDKCHATPLHLALGYKARWNMEVFKALLSLLLESGADVNVSCDEGRTPLHLAATIGSRDVISSLLARGANLDAQDINHSTPLHLASSRNDVESVELLIEFGANILARNKQGRTPLHVALGYRNLDVMRLLLDRGAVLDTYTTLHEASFRGEVDLVNLLLKYGASVHPRNNEDKTALHTASKWGNLETMRILLNQGAEVDAQDRYHLTPLHLASSRMKVEAVGLLIKCGANVHARNDDGMTALHFASKCGILETMQLLLNQSAEVDGLNNCHFTPLHLASLNNKVEAVKLLIKCGANVHARAYGGKTALHFASMFGNFETMEFLLSQNVEVDAQDNFHITPLHLASFHYLDHNSVDAVELLINRGANIHARSNEGETPLHFVSKRGDLETVRYLLDKGATVDAQDNNHLTPLYLALCTSDVKLVELLIEYGANPHVQNKEGVTPFQVASKKGNVEIKRLLSKPIHPTPKRFGIRVRRIFSLSKKPRMRSIWPSYVVYTHGSLSG
jgi:ankyrin repeat protein